MPMPLRNSCCGPVPTSRNPGRALPVGRGHPDVQLALALQSPAARRAAGLCLLEGPHLVGEALDAGLVPVAAFVTASLAASDAAVLGRLRLALAAAGCGERLHVVGGRLSDALARTRTPQGCAAVFQLAAVAARPVPVAVALDGVQDPGNVGAIARCLLAFGGAGSLLLTGPGTADPLGDKALRASAGAVFRLAHLAVTDLTAALDPERAWWALQPRGGIVLSAGLLQAPVGLVVGSEGAGVSPGVAARCRRLTLAMSGPVESLNAAVAVGIALHAVAPFPPRS